MDAIKYYKRLVSSDSLKELKEAKKGSWINVINPKKDDFDFLESQFKLDRQNLESGIDRYEVPRVEFDGDDMYVISKIISPDNSKELHTFMIIVTGEHIITVCRYMPRFLKEIVSGKTRFITTQKLKSLLHLLSKINNQFERKTLELVKKVNATREKIRRLSDRDIESLMEEESILNNFVSSYHYMKLVYQRVIKNKKFYDEDKEVIDDLIIEAQEGLDLCSSSLKTISNIRNHSVILLSNQLNKVITLLTVFTIFISVPAAISGFYGMNVALPLQNDPNAFYYGLGMIGCLWGIIFLFFKIKRVF